MFEMEWMDGMRDDMSDKGMDEKGRHKIKYLASVELRIYRT